MITGADLDKTYTDFSELWGIVDLIITGRSWEEFDTIQEDMAGLPKKPIFINPTLKKNVTLLNIVNHKANMINKLAVGKFYENNPQEVTMLQLLCPDCKIILVKPNNTYI